MAGRSYGGRSSSSVLQFGFQQHSFVYTKADGRMCAKLRRASKLSLAPEFPERNFCAGPGVFVYVTAWQNTRITTATSLWRCFSEFDLRSLLLVSGIPAGQRSGSD